MWKSVLRKAGYNPAVVKDGVMKLEVGEVQRQDLNGSVIGDPCNCCGAKLIRRRLDAELAWVGAEFAIVVYNKNRIVRYKHNGGIPSKFDAGFFPLGVPLRLNPPAKSDRLGSATVGRKTPTPEKRKQPFKNRFPSIVGQFRR